MPRIAIALVVLVALALPGTAAAAVYTVDSTGTSIDKDPSDGICESYAEDCSLIAAIEEANEPSGTADEVVFSDQFDGGIEDTIAVGQTEYVDKLPLLRSSLTIDGGRCMTDAGVLGPCVGIAGSFNAPMVRVSGTDVTIRGVAFSGETHELLNVGSSQQFHITGSWFGVGLDGAETPSWTGIILEGGTSGATIGGDGAAAENVFVAATKQAIDIDGSRSNHVIGNSFGIAPDGGAPAPDAVDVEVSDRTTQGGTIVHREATDNEIAKNLFAGAGVGIDLSGEGAVENELPAAGPTTIRGNRFEGGGYGIYGAGGGLEVAGNTIEGTSADGMLLEGSGGLIVGNRVIGSGAAGILIKSPAPGVDATANLVGGDSPGAENEISGSNGPAIEVLATETSLNEIARNRGSDNDGPFIDLVSFDPGTEPGWPSQGIAPPSLTVADPLGAGGLALPFSRVRVFRKASSDPGELASFLAETVAGAGGSWSVSYPAPIPTGTIVAATQTADGGTSELATALTGEGTKGGGGGDGGGGGAVDRTPPGTRILKGPRKAHQGSIAFEFVATEAGSTFQCRLDRRPFRSCRSPKAYGNLRVGKHVFRVRAIDQAGNVDLSPARRKFTVLG